MKVKLTAIILIFFCAMPYVKAQKLIDTPVKLSYKEVPLKNILLELSEEHSLNFSYGDLDLAVLQTFDFEGSLKDAISQLLSSNDLLFKQIGDQIVLKYDWIEGRPVRGIVIDEQSQVPLVGASISALNAVSTKGSFSDIEGYFDIKGLRVGRYDFVVQYLGYEPMVINQVLVTAGKEVFLKTKLRESTTALTEVVVKVKKDPSKAVNDMAGPTARSFSVEQTQRFAAAISDPARMVQSYAGVSSGGDDLSNEIIIRGNSSRGLLWKIEGVEVPNPNHFGGMGAGGGAISMLSAATMDDSDFYTGAFPAEFGNALSGVFDIRMRSGNKDKREHSIVLGNLGLEASSEGYFTKKSNASYLINYRYSTIELINKYLPSLGRQIPAYRDLSYKINVPTKRFGLFSLFGLRGQNSTKVLSTRQPDQWVNFVDELDYFEQQKLRVYGLSHRYLLSDNAYLSTTLSSSGYDYYDLTERLDPQQGFEPDTIDESVFYNQDFSFSLTYHRKINAKNKVKIGAVLTNKNFDYDYLAFEPDFSKQKYLQNSGSTNFLQSFAQWQYYLSDKWEVNAGIHFSYLFLNNTYGIDPRLSAKYQLSQNQNISLSLGHHSKPEHPSTYFIERFDPSGTVINPNINLSMSKAVHLVAGYNLKLQNNTRLLIEAYYQHLYNIPVSTNPESGFSVVNVFDVFDIVFENDRSRYDLTSKGVGKNYGLEFTLEKSFSKGYYYLVTASIFDSKYAGLNAKWYNTAVANNFLFNALYGKEWFLGKQKKNVLALNGKFVFYDGNRDTPIDLEASRMAGTQVNVPNDYFGIKLKPYIRFDLGISFKINTEKTTHTFAFNLQNITNRFNVYNQYYDIGSGNILDEKQNGFIPFMSYKFDFSL